MIDKKVKLFIPFALVVAGIVGFVVWLSNHSYINIVVNDNIGENNITYIISGSTSKVNKDSKNKTLKKLVKRGSYGVTVTSNNKSYFKSVDTGRFLSTTNIYATLSPEKYRSFIGDNPEDCSHFNGTVLISWACSDLYENLSKHVPATRSSPAYIQKTKDILRSGYLMGVTSNNEGTLALVSSLEHVSPNVESGFGSYFLQVIDNDLKITKEKELGDIPKGADYGIDSSGTGFVIYDKNYKDIAYYKSIDDNQPKKLKLNMGDTKNARPQQLSVSSYGMISFFSNSESEDIDNLGKEESKKTSTLFVYTNGEYEPRRLEIDGRSFTSAEFCWKDKLCLVSSEGLEVYSTDNTSNGPLYLVPNVVATKSLKSSILMATPAFLYSFNPDTREGLAEYSFGGYGFCGLSQNGNSPTLCISDNKGRRSMLFLDEQKNNVDSIDKKILDLKKTPGIKSVSVSGDVIYITVDAGELVYSEQKQAFDYNETSKNTAINNANKMVDKLGVDRNKYFISVLPN